MRYLQKSLLTQYPCKCHCLQGFSQWNPQAHFLFRREVGLKKEKKKVPRDSGLFQLTYLSMTILTRIIFPPQVLDFLHTCVLKIIETNPQQKQNRSFSHILRNVIHIPVIKKLISFHLTNSISPKFKGAIKKGTNHLQKQLRLLFKNLSGTDIITVKEWQKLVSTLWKDGTGD